MEKEKDLEYARDWREICFQKIMLTEKRGSELEDEFIRLQVQIAAILFAFSGVFVDKFATLTKTLSPGIGGFIRGTYALAIFSLVLSLGMGLLHLKRTGKFWESFLEMRDARFAKWNQAVRGLTSVEEAQAFHDGVAGGRTGVAYSPAWAWISQSVLLAVAVLLLFVVFIAFLLWYSGPISSVSA